MNNPKSPGKASNFPGFDGDDIPEALRDTPTPGGSSRRIQSQWVWVGLGLATFLLVVALGGVWQFQASSQAEAVASAVSPLREGLRASLGNLGIQFPDTLLGHRPYEEAPETTLASITADGSVKMREAAAKQFLNMSEAARRDGVYLVPLSGFRSVEYQKYLFFGIKAEEGQVPRERAELSAPPGYSEHHTGYAVDIGDADRSEADVQPEFEQTKAFRWLQRNAARYNFELSFPEDNIYGVGYEPWHWRFVGDTDSLETFYAHSPRGESSAPAGSN